MKNSEKVHSRIHTTLITFLIIGIILSCIVAFFTTKQTINAERSIEESKVLLDTTQRLTRVGGWEWDVEKQLTHWTNEVYRIHDTRPYDFEPNSSANIERCLNCYDPEDQPVIMAAFQLAIEKGQGYDLEFPFTTFEGNKIWIRTIAEPVFTGDTVTKVIGNIIDITERKQVREALRASNERLLTVLNSIDATIYVADMESYEILFANKGMLKAFGRDVTGEVCYDVFRKSSEPCGYCTNDQLIDENGKPTGVCIWQAENPIIKKWYVNYDRAIEWIDGRLVRLQIATDITHIKKMEQQLQQAQKFEAIGTLAGGIAHQFNNVLFGITGSLSLLEMDFQGDETVTKYTKQMNASASRMAQLTAQLLAYAKGGKYKTETVPLNDLLQKTLPLVQPTIGSDIHVGAVFPQDILNVKVDLTQMQMVLSAVLTNASEAMEGTGLVRVAYQKIAIVDNATKDFPGLKPGEYACLSVTDGGKGMDEETRTRAFEPFFSTKFEGRGLGMAAVYGIVKNHDGWISVDSELGKGTTVKIYLPSVETPAIDNM